ncbi:hypothetical protein GA0070621_3990 [Micromonospora narathiwatensis]|uniref:Uncharacterized protein n=1 Tax=Micromonospora narathiwatensis TaxID=299146 RepID=A0A1A9A4W8_9ACTN|nr:hypothetical protein GA0070621_3990 [Micromonospora narathiwatensis]
MKAHRTDIVSFAFGLVFLALSVWWLLARILGLTLPPVGWFLAGALILVGLLSLVGALRSGRHSDAVTDVPLEARQDRPAEPAYGSPVEALSTDDLTPAGSPEGPTRELAPLGDGRDVGAEPSTRELPAVDSPQWPAGGPRTDGDEPGRDERSTG